MTSIILMEECPKYRHCDAPLCPLDPEWSRRKMVQDENLCHYLCEASKDGARTRFIGRYDEEVFLIALGLSEEMKNYSKALKRGLERAESSPSVLLWDQLELF